MKQLIWIAAALALAACSKKGDNAAKSDDTSVCAAVAAKAVASLPDGDGTGVKAKLQSIYAARCAEDKWSPEAIKCYETASGQQGLMACRAKLPPELGTKLRNEVMAAMMGAGAGMGGMGGAPPMGHGGGAGAPGGEPSGAGGAPGAGGDPAGAGAGGAAPGGAAPGGTAPGGDPPATGGPAPSAPK